MELEENAVIGNFVEYQNKFFSIIEKLKEGTRDGRFKDWKGFITINGPVVFKPELLNLRQSREIDLLKI